MIDPVDGRSIPDVPGRIVAVAGDRALTRLGDGGAAILRPDATGPTVRIAPTVVARATCTWPDFPHVATARNENIGCSELQLAAGVGRLVVSPGRAPTSAIFEITTIDVDTAARVLTIRYRDAATSRFAGPTAQVAVVDVASGLSGDWLTWLVPEDRPPSYSTGPAFAISLP